MIHAARTQDSGLDGLQPIGDGIGHGHRVGVGRPVDRRFDAFLAVDAGDDLAFLVAAEDLGHAAQRDQNVAPPVDDDVPDLLDGFELVDRPDEVLAVLLFQDPGREIDVFLGQAVGHGRYRQVQKTELLLVEVDVDLVLESAGDRAGGHAFDALQGLFELALGDEADVGEIRSSGDPQLHDGLLVGIVAEDDGFCCALGEADEVEFFAELEGREIHVGVPGEFDRDFGHFGPGDRRDADDVVHDAAGFLDGLGDDVFDFGGRGSRVFRADGQGRVGDIGQQVQVQTGVGDESENDRGDGEHEHRNRTAKRKMNDFHRMTSIAWPSLSPSTPTVTMTSPSTSPSVTSTSSSSLRPIWISRWTALFPSTTKA